MLPRSVSNSWAQIVHCGLKSASGLTGTIGIISASVIFPPVLFLSICLGFVCLVWFFCSIGTQIQVLTLSNNTLSSSVPVFVISGALATGHMQKAREPCTVDPSFHLPMGSRDQAQVGRLAPLPG